jgi:hypothetical protein
MGFLSSLFGGGDSRPATTTNVVSQKLPDEIAPFVSEVLKEGKAQFEAEKAAGYRPYTGQTSADLTTEQERALAGLSGLIGTQQPFLDESGEIIRRGAEEFTGDTAQKFMSPYQQAVTDIEKREATRNFEGNILPRLEAQAVGAGAMSGLGSRAGVEFAEAQRNQAQLLADIQAKGQQRAFDAARNEFGLQKSREAQMASNIANLGGRQVSADLTELGALKSAGEERQQQAQGALDEAYFKFLEEQQFPKQNLAEYSQLIYGNPLTRLPTTSSTGTSAPFQPSTGQNLLGIGLGAANIFGLGGGFSSDGFSRDRASNAIFGGPRRAEGGKVDEGLSSLPVVKAQVGTPGGMVIPQQVQDIENLTARYAIETDPIKKEKIRVQIAGTYATPKSADLKKEIDSNIQGTKTITEGMETKRKEARSTGLEGIKDVLDAAKETRTSELSTSQKERRSNLIKAMSSRGASTKEIQDALNAMPQRGPGLSTKTGSAAGIGQDIVNILDTLRTDVNKQRALDDAQKRADILNIGKMKRSDMEKGIVGESSITEAGATGRSKISEADIAGKKLISERQASDIMKGLNEEEKNDLLIHAQEVAGKKDIRALSISQLNEYYKKRDLELKEKKAITDRIAAGKKGKTAKTPQGYIKDITFDILQGTKFKIDPDDPTGTKIMVKDGVTLEKGDAEEVQEMLMKARSDFYDNLGKATDVESMNEAYNKWNKTFRLKKSDTWKNAQPPQGVPSGVTKRIKNGKIVWQDKSTKDVYDNKGKKIYKGSL